LVKIFLIKVYYPEFIKYQSMAGDKHIPNTQWNEDRPRQVYMMALLGLTEKQMCDVMGIHQNTLTYWKSTNKSGIDEMIRRGKEEADMKVVESFYNNCIDRYVEEEEVHVYKGQPIKVKVKKFIQGDKWAQARWLALRRKEQWSEVQRVEMLNLNLNLTKIDFSGLTEEDLLLAKKIGLTQLQLAQDTTTDVNN
jgi:transcriptional regulator with XRE-family HTH domain